MPDHATPPIPEESGQLDQLEFAADAVLAAMPWELDQPPPAQAATRSAQGHKTPLSPPPLERIIEALLFVGGPPLTPARAADIIHGLTPGQFLEAIAALNSEYQRQGRPYVIACQDQGYSLALKPSYQPLIDRLHGTAREAKLSPAAIDVLALVAYRQPTTKQEIDGLRGVESGPVLRQLVRRGLIAASSHGEARGRQVVYGTTARFLELFGLERLDDLPQTQDLQIL